MKGLLLKDIYLTSKYCRWYFVIMIAFALVSAFSNGNMFYSIYPCIMACMIPVTLMGYDEQSRWDDYCDTLPCSRAEAVSAKYLTGLLTEIIAVAVSAIADAVRMIINSSFSLEEYMTHIALFLVIPLVMSSFMLPVIFKLGVEKGRILYLLIVGAAFGGVAVVYGLLGSSAFNKFNVTLPMICGAAVIMYILSWYISTVFYEKRKA